MGVQISLWDHDFISLVSKFTAYGDCSHEIKRRLLLGRKAMINLVRILKAETSLYWNVPSSQNYGLPSSHVLVWELDHKEGWALKYWSFWTEVLEKTLERPWDCKDIQPVHPKGNQSWIFMEGLMLKLKLQHVGHLMQRIDLLEKTLMLKRLKEGGEGGDRAWDGWIASPTQWTWVWASSGCWWWTGKPDMLPWGRKESDMTEKLNWTEFVKK